MSSRLAGASSAECREKRTGCVRSVRMLRFPVVAELGDRAGLALRNKDRIEAEAGVAARAGCDPAFERALPTALLASRAEGDELAHVPSMSGIALQALKLLQHPPDLVPGGAARGMDARASSQAGDFDAGILAEHPERRRRERAAEPGLRQRVVVVRRARFGRIVLHVQDLDLPAGQQPLQLARLVRVARGELRSQSLQRTSATYGTSAIRATSRGAATSRGSARSSSSLRRSPSWLTSIESIRAPLRSISSITAPGGEPEGSSTSRRPSSGRYLRRMRYATIRRG